MALSRVANARREVAVMTINAQVAHAQFSMFLRGLRDSGCRHFMFFALDGIALGRITDAGMGKHVWLWDRTKAVQNNEKTGVAKADILVAILALGYSPLLMDMDIILLDDPLAYLWRDADVEAMTDAPNHEMAAGWDEVKDDPSMGWSRYHHNIGVSTVNFGFVFIRAGPRTLDLARRFRDRMASGKPAWDQLEYNVMLFGPSYRDRKSFGVTVRVLDVECFCNSKFFLRSVRNRADFRPTGETRPVLVHVNYNCGKVLAMRSVAQFYWLNDVRAIQAHPNNGDCHGEDLLADKLAPLEMLIKPAA